MTLDEAIKHAEEVAEGYKKKLKVYENIDEDRPLFTEEETECRLCAAEHRQLAEWLKELKQLREQTRWTPVSEKLPEEHELMGTKRFGTTISDEVYVTFETPDGERFTKHLSFQNGGLSQTDQERMSVWFKGAVPIAWMSLPKPYEPQESEEKDV